MNRLARYFVTATPRPADPAYFTGNSKYYQLLRKTNDLIRSNNLDFNTPCEYDPIWMSRTQMQNDLAIRINEENYNELVQKLTLLKSVGDKEFLSQFIPVGKSLEKPLKPKIELDEHGRSLTYGSRKTAKAQVYLIKGSGQIYINGIIFDDYFRELKDRQKVILPFERVDALCKYNVWAIVNGGGKTGIMF